MNKKRFSGVTKKISVGMLLTALFVLAGAIFAGYITFKNSIEKRYNDICYQIADAARGYFTESELQEYLAISDDYVSGKISKSELERVIQSDRYQEAQRLLDQLRISMDANDIFVYSYDVSELKNYDKGRDDAGEWNPIHYIMDSYPSEELQYHIGDCGAILAEYIPASLEAVETGVRPADYLISKGTFGYNTSAMLPICINGKTVAFIGVEIPMSTLQSDIRDFILRVVLFGAIITAVLTLIAIVYFYQKIAKPINTVSAETGKFIENNAEVSSGLSRIKTRDEIQKLSENILKMEVDIKEYIENITTITAEKERVGAELNVATHIQKSMLPCIFPAFPERKEFDIYATMDPAKEVGGDFYDFFMIDPTHLVIVMADVSGKGVPAALFMVIGKTLIKDHTQPERDLGEVFTEVNNLLCESNSEGLFITAFEGVLDLVTGEFRFVNAGHELPFICKKDGTYKPYQVRRALVLAGMEDIRYKAGSMMLEPGDRFFQYTDGVTEATNADNQLYGMGRLEQSLNRNLDKTMDELLPALKADIDLFVGGAPQFDDITMLGLEYKARMAEE